MEPNNNKLKLTIRWFFIFKAILGHALISNLIVGFLGGMLDHFNKSLLEKFNGQGGIVLGMISYNLLLVFLIANFLINLKTPEIVATTQQNNHGFGLFLIKNICLGIPFLLAIIFHGSGQIQLLGTVLGGSFGIGLNLLGHNKIYETRR